MRPLLLLQAVILFLGSSLPGSASNNNVIHFEDSEWDDDLWTVTTRSLNQGHYQSRMSLANGYIGINVAAVGPFFEVDLPVQGDNLNGWPLFDTRQTFATVAGFYNNMGRTTGSNYPWLYQYGTEGFISGIPHWAGLIAEANGAMLNASVDKDHVSDFKTSLDVRGGIMSWEFSWQPGGDGDPINVEYSMFVHKLYVNQAAVQLKLTATRDVNVTVYDVLDGTTAVRTEFVDKEYETESPTIWSAVSPANITNVTAYIYSTLGCNGNDSVDLGTRAKVTEGVFGSANDSSIAQSVKVNLLTTKTAEITKYVGIASSDAFSDPKAIAKKASTSGASLGYPALIDSHIEEWATILTPDSVDSYHLPNGSLPANERIRELQVISITSPFHLLQNTVGPNAIAAAGNNSKLNIHSIPVCGLGSDCYGGMIFWDAETWMAPGLQASHPQHIESIVNYRIEQYPQAKDNIKTAFTSSKNQTGRFTGGAVYPWTSARFGNCTGTGPCFDYQYHLNGDIAIAFRNQFTISGDAQKFKEQMLPISNDIAYFFGEVIDFNETSGYYELWNATDPDEYANNVDRIGFTTALIQKHFNETNELNEMFDIPQNESWFNMSSNMRLPVDTEVGIVLEYSSMNGSLVVKQADVVLIDDVLHYNNPYSLANLDYYAAKQSKDGPSMTYSSFSIVANEISPSGCSSFTYDVYSSQPYIRAPWFQFSEQLIDDVTLNGGTHPAFPFLTGMGGANRVGVYGYLGLRLFVDRLDIDPSLPPQITNLNYRTFYWQGHGINATSNATHTTLRRLENVTLSTANSDYKDKPIPVTLGTREGNYTLGNEPLIVPNRMVGQKETIEGNILQCKAIIPNTDPFLPGQFPFAAIDGAASTKWQTQNVSTTSYLTVDLGTTSFYPIKEVQFDWADQPPVYYEVLFSNTSLPPFSSSSDVRKVTSGNVTISEPYDPSKAYIIERVKGNQTNVTVSDEVWSGRYAHLGIRGNVGNESATVGGTVAEWSVIKA